MPIDAFRTTGLILILYVDEVQLKEGSMNGIMSTHDLGVCLYFYILTFTYTLLRRYVFVDMLSLLSNYANTLSHSRAARTETDEKDLSFRDSTDPVVYISVTGLWKLACKLLVGVTTI